MDKKILLLILVFLGIFLAGTVKADSSNVNATVCCEKTGSGLYCQDVPSSQCPSSSRQVPSACNSVSYCQPGFCYDSTEGTCQDSTPQNVCNANNGTWSLNFPPQCGLGCCALGDQAAFVPLVRCKRLSSFLGLQTNFNSQINDELTCALSVKSQDKGACVYESDFEKTCKFTTRADCSSITGNSTASNVTFYAGLLCSAEQLGTNCGPSSKTTCVPGKDGVYFLDTCGNVANIYDSSKLKDTEYWTNVKDTSQACGAGSANIGSPGCGNCNYLLGSICRSTNQSNTQATPNYGTNICANLNCANTQNGKSYKHGESWCVFNDVGTPGSGKDSVGSDFYTHICEDGQEVVEPCADFRQEICIQDKISTPQGDFSQAACRVNRWQDCNAQLSEKDCANTDKRDCTWKPGVSLSAINGSEAAGGVCLPTDPPGLNFWSDPQSTSYCSLGNAQCVCTFSKGLLTGTSTKGTCACFNSDGSVRQSWQDAQANLCSSLGDCGNGVNWVGQHGYNSGYNVTVT